jgi:hypothetical protein
LLSPLSKLKSYRSHVASTPSFITTVTQEGILFRTPKLLLFWRFERFHRYREQKRVFLFWSDEEHFEMLAKRGFDAKQLEIFREILRKKFDVRDG